MPYKDPIKVAEKCKKWEAAHREARSATKKKYRDANPDYCKNYRLQYNYGITLEDWKIMFEKQNGCCAICNTHQSLLSRTLVVDHDHKTGKVRNLLCDGCNVRLGNCKEDPDILRKTADYIEYHNKLHTT